MIARVSLALLLIIVAGCSSPPGTAGMTCDAPPSARAHAASLRTQVTVAPLRHETFHDGNITPSSSTIDPEDFQVALDESIRRSGAAAVAAAGGAAKVVLHVDVERYGFRSIDRNGATIGVDARWSLTREGEPAPFWESRVSSDCFKSNWDSFFAATRTRRATEGAIRENFRKGIEQLAAVDF